MQSQIEKLGHAFRGLWKSYILEPIDHTSYEELVEPLKITEQWSVTYIYKGHYVETPYMGTPEEALAFAVKALK